MRYRDYTRGVPPDGTEIFGPVWQGNADKSLTLAQCASIGTTLNLVSFGADRTGATDSTAALNSAVTAALSYTYGATIVVPPGRFKFSSAPAAIALPSGQHIGFVGTPGATFMEFAAGINGLAMTLAPITTGDTIPILNSPAVVISGIVMLTGNTGNTQAGTAISITQTDTGVGQSNILQFARVMLNDVQFIAANGGCAGTAGSATGDSWLVGLNLLGLSNVRLKSIGFVGGLTNLDTSSTGIIFDANGSQHAVELAVVDYRVQGGNLGLHCGNTAQTTAVQGIHVLNYASAGPNNDILFEAKDNGGLLQIVSGSFNPRVNGVKIVGGSGGSHPGNGGLQVVNSHFIGILQTGPSIWCENAEKITITGSDFLTGGSSQTAAILIHGIDAAASDTAGNTIVGNRFLSVTNSRVGIQLTGTTDYTLIQGNEAKSSVGTASLVLDQTGNTHNIIGPNLDGNGVFQTGSALTLPGLTVTGNTQTMGQSGAMLLHGQTSGGSAIRLTSDGAAAGATNVFNIAAGRARGFTVNLAGYAGAGAFSYGWTVQGLLRRGAAGNVVGTFGTPAVLTDGAGSPTVSITADTTNQGLNLTVTPADTDAWSYDAVIQWSEANLTQ